jgi:dihydroxyacid dehydratase/phosphogluconate dehydratase
MKMHSIKFKDPLISRAQPVTIISPIVEETLRSAGIAADRDQILEHFMNGHPRIAIVHGGDDHPPSLGMKETVRRTVRQVWANEALPFEIAQDVPCEELARGTDGAGYGLLSRNLCTGSLAAHMEAHSYDAAIIFGVCDKMLVGNLRALAETDLIRQRRRGHPLFAMVLPSLIGREVFTTEEDRRRFEPLRHRLSPADRAELDQLLQRPLKTEVYAGLKCLLDRCFHQRLLTESEKDDLEHLMARCTAVPGANCGASEASMVHRMMLAAFGIVPRGLDILLKPPSDQQISEPIRRLLTAIQKRERRVSVAGLIRSNMGNAASVWSATGGHPAWILHLSYLADAVGKKITVADVARKARTIPQILGIQEAPGHSVYTLAQETESGGNSGIDTIMRTLAEKRLIEDRAPTLDGSWMQRIMDARSANGNFLFSTMTPFSSSCGMSGVHGNLCSWGVARLGVRGRGGMALFDKKVYLTVYYLGHRELQADMALPDGILERLKHKVTRDDLYYTWLANWANGPAQSTNGTAAAIQHWNKPKLWDYLLEEKLLRVVIVVAGVGPRAAGMPELDLSTAMPASLSSMAVLITDGRVSFAYDGISIGHVVPEALDGGPLSSVRTGDWIHVDLAHGELHVVRELKRHRGFRPISPKDLLNRPDRRKRIHELQRQRMDLLPSIRLLLDHVSSAEAGVAPLNKVH